MMYLNSVIGEIVIIYARWLHNTPISLSCQYAEGVRLVTAKSNLYVMEDWDLSIEQVQELRTFFVLWSEKRSGILIEAGYEQHDDIAKLFLREIADAIVCCDISIMTTQERQKDREDWHDSMEGTGGW